MVSSLKVFFKRNSHNGIFRALAGFGRSLNRLYENRNHDIRSNGELQVIKKIGSLAPGVIIDSGANIGKYAALMAKYAPGSQIYAFEPVRGTFETLEKNVSEYPQVTCLNKGLFNREGTETINLFPSHTHSSLYDIKGLSYDVKQTEEIQLIRGDAFLASEGIKKVDFLKIDVEGAEFEVLQGFEDAISKGNIRAIQFEYGYINITRRKLLLDFYEFFEPYGYKVGKIFPKTVEFRDYEFKYEDFLGPNFIAIRKDDEELIRKLTRR